MQARLFVNIVHGLVGRVGRCLIHYNNQMSILVMLQHLPQELDHFLRADALFVQFEDQPP